jgi:hypothetical protein
MPTPRGDGSLVQPTAVLWDLKERFWVHMQWCVQMKMGAKPLEFSEPEIKL